MAFSPIDQVVASASSDATIRLWNLKDFRAIRSFQGHSSAVLRVAFLGNGMQLMSSSVDGLLKLWHIRTAECAATLEEHTSKVWCIDILGDRMVSGGADSKICVWRDSTLEVEKQRQDEKADLAIKDSRIGLLVREGKVEAALTLALELKRPGQMQQILLDHTMDLVGRRLFGSAEGAPSVNNTVSGKSRQKRGMQRGRKGDRQKSSKGDQDGTIAVAGGEAPNADIDLRRWVLSLTDPQLEQLVDMLEQWNSNRRMAPLAQMLFAILLLSVPATKLSSLEGMNATCGNVLSYAQRHMARIESLLQKTFLFDLILQDSSGLAIQEGQEAPQNGDEEPLDTSAEAALKRTMDVLLGDTDEANDLEMEEAEEEPEEEPEDDVIEEDDPAEEEPGAHSAPKKRKTA